MWFKQIQMFRLNDNFRYNPELFASQLAELEFSPCLPSMPFSIGWVAPVDEDGAPLFYHGNGYVMLCMQVEEKILPAAVIKQELENRVKKIAKDEDRRVRRQEKISLKEDVIISLLPRAFSKLTRIYGYIDIKNHWLILNTLHGSKTEKFMSLFKKSITEDIQPFALNKLAPEITQWLKADSYPKEFSIEKSCLLQDPKDQARVIRCQQQDLFAQCIQDLLKDGCEVNQLAMCWQDRVNFILAENFSVRSLRYQEEIQAQIKEMEIETKLQQFAADFFIMTATLSALLRDLIALFVKPTLVPTTPKVQVMETA
jgi:recombination associated protein RdgC